MKNGEANAGALPEPEVLARNEYGVPIARGYTTEQFRALMAERDAARKEAAAFRKELTLTVHKVITCGVAASHSNPDLSRRKADYGGPWDSPQAEDVRKLRDERDALRQSLWDVYAALGCDTDGDPTPAALVGDLGALVLDAAKEAAKDYREACDAIPPDAREGREPLTQEQQHALWQKANGDWLTDEADFKAGIRAAERAHGIGPAGTSAEGEHHGS